jgi:hypothetical protein
MFVKVKNLKEITQALIQGKGLWYVVGEGEASIVKKLPPNTNKPYQRVRDFFDMEGGKVQEEDFEYLMKIIVGGYNHDEAKNYDRQTRGPENKSRKKPRSVLLPQQYQVRVQSTPK